MLKTKNSKILSLVMSAALIMSNFTGLDGVIKAHAATGDKVFDLVEITDFHGTLLDTYTPPNQVGAVLADRVKKVTAANSNTIVIGGGDLYQGSAISNMLKGVPVQQVLSNMGLEVTALGNHEFDWGLDTVINETMKDATYSIICANLYNKLPDGSNGTRKFAPYKVITKDSVRIAFIGAISNETPTIVMPAFVDNFNFTDVATEVNAVAKDIKDNDKADVIIAVLHEGNDGDNKTTGKIIDIANSLKNVNAVFGGHSHTELHVTAPTSNIPVYIAKSNGKGYIDAKMTVKADKTVSFPAPGAADYIALDNANGYKTTTPIVDAQAKAIIDAAAAQVAPITQEVIGHNSKAAITRTQMKTTDNPAGTYGSSVLGNWAADATRQAVGAEVGMQNNGGLRIDIPVADIKVDTMWQFMPFDNTIYKMTMTKAQIKAVLEQAVMDGGKGIQISGIKFTYDSTKTSYKAEVKDSSGKVTSPEVPGNRIVAITREDGTAITDSEKLTVAAPDFVATGGDNFTAFKAVTTNHPELDTHILVRNAFIENIKANISQDPSIVTSNVNRITNAAKIVASVVATSDVHGSVYNYDYATGKAPSTAQGLVKVSSYVNGLRSANPNIMLVDNGDTIQGTPLSYYYDMLDAKAEYPMMKVMGAMGYDAWTLGNHEYNYGLTTLNRIINDAKTEGIKVLSANTYNGSSNFVDPYVLKTFNVNGKALKVAVIGLTTKTVPSWEDTAHYAGLQFNDLVDEANKWVPIVKAKGADVVIISAHTGEESSADVIPENQAKALAAKVADVDVVLAGHAHNVIPNVDGTYSTKENMQGYVVNEKTGKQVLITEPGKNAQYVSQIDVIFNSEAKVGAVTTKVVPMSNIADDPAIAALAQPYQDKTLEYIQTVLGTSTDEYKGAGQYVVPTALMDLINKVQMEAAGAQLSIAAPLSSSAYIPKGNVTIKDIMGVYVYENFLFGLKMTGKQIKDWMEYDARYYKQINDPNLKIDINTDYKTLKNLDPKVNIADYNLDMLYGATYDIDLTEPATEVDNSGNVTKWGGRIKNLKFNGKLIKDTDVFTVAINNYRFNGGGGFMKAAGLTVKDANGKDVPNPALVTFDSGKTLGDDGQVRSLMMSYIQNHKTITPDCSNNWKLSTVAVQQQVDVVVDNTDTTKVVDAVKNATVGSITTVNIGTTSTVSKDVFNAIKGLDKTVVFEKDGVTWTFNGKDLTSDATADIDLSLETVSSDLKAKETAKIKAVVGKDVTIVPFSFKYDGPLPGNVSVKVFIGTEWANKVVYINRYYADKNTYETVAEGTVDANGYVTFTTNHCSDYFIMEKSVAPSLPKTGSPVDMGVLVNFGMVVAMLGVAMIFADRRKRRSNAA